MPFLITVAVIISLAAGGVLVYYLISVITALRSITSKLANARVLLLASAEQTEPAGELVGGIGGNIGSLHELVTGVAHSLGLPLAGAR